MLFVIPNAMATALHDNTVYYNKYNIERAHVIHLIEDTGLLEVQQCIHCLMTELNLPRGSLTQSV